MSPFLFALAMEYFSSLLHIQKGKDISFHPKCKKFGVMKLLFADDLIFTKPDAKSVYVLQEVLDDMADVSGLHINKAKSAIYFAGISASCEQAILDVLTIPKGELPFRYLGFPLSNKRLGIKNCLPIVEKIIARLNHWATKKLSMAGRIQLVQNVIQRCMLIGVRSFCCLNPSSR